MNYSPASMDSAPLGPKEALAFIISLAGVQNDADQDFQLSDGEMNHSSLAGDYSFGDFNSKRFE